MGKRFRYANNRGLYPQIKNHQLGWWIFILPENYAISVTSRFIIAPIKIALR